MGKYPITDLMINPEVFRMRLDIRLSFLTLMINLFNLISLIHQTFRQLSLRNIELIILKVHLVDGIGHFKLELYCVHLRCQVVGQSYF